MMGKMKPKAYTETQARELFLASVRRIAAYWATLPGEHTAEERCNGVVFSILNVLDGTHGGSPSYDVVARPHPDDEAYLKSQGKQWHKDGTIINSGCLLHELYYKKEAALAAKS